MSLYFDTGPALKTEFRTGRAIKMADAIKSRYTSNPETVMYVAADIEDDGYTRAMIFEGLADDHVQLPLVRPNDTVTIGAYSFIGNKICLRSLSILWRYEPLPLPERSNSPESLKPTPVSAKGRIFRVGKVLSSDHQHPESTVHMAVELRREEDGLVHTVVFKADVDNHPQLVLGEEGNHVEIKYIPSSYTLGEVCLKDFEIDWDEVRRPFDT